MEQINATDRPMYLEDYIDMNKIKAFGTETVLNIFANSCKLISHDDHFDCRKRRLKQQFYCLKFHPNPSSCFTN
jgi:hypothetical protein